MATYTGQTYSDIWSKSLGTGNTYVNCTFNNIGVISSTSTVLIQGCTFTDCPDIQASGITTISTHGTYGETSFTDCTIMFEACEVSGTSFLNSTLKSDWGSIYSENWVNFSSEVYFTDVDYLIRYGSFSEGNIIRTNFLGTEEEPMDLQVTNFSANGGTLENINIYSKPPGGAIGGSFSDFSSTSKVYIHDEIGSFAGGLADNYNELILVGGTTSARNVGTINPHKARKLRVQGQIDTGTLYCSENTSFEDLVVGDDVYPSTVDVTCALYDVSNLDSTKTGVGTTTPGIQFGNSITNLKFRNENDGNSFTTAYITLVNDEVVSKSEITDNGMGVSGGTLTLKDSDISGTQFASTSTVNAVPEKGTQAIGTSFSAIDDNTIENKTLVGVSLRDSDWDASASFSDIKFVKCDLRGAQFQNTTWTNCTFVDTDATGADFSGANLTGTTIPSDIGSYTRYQDLLEGAAYWVEDPEGQGNSGTTPVVALQPGEAAVISMNKGSGSNLSIAPFVHETLPHKYWGLNQKAAAKLNMSEGKISNLDTDYLDDNCIVFLEDTADGIFRFPTVIRGRYYFVIQNTGDTVTNVWTGDNI